MNPYDHKAIEAKWQKTWADQKLYNTANHVEGKENKYLLFELPYPSGNLHVGHWYAFSLPDIYARQLRMQGYNVLYPIGFDSFGLPAENAAIKRGLDPKKWTYSNMDYMRTQLASMGTSIDWSRQIATSDPSYYKWTQWLFAEFLKNDLVYQNQTQVNWCPSCKTVLANEQVVDSACGRCGHTVEQKDMKQWSFRITKFADQLLNDLDKLDWPDAIKASQRAWIGKSEGAEIDFAVDGTDESIKVFTTRPDTIYGATYMVLAPEHALVQKLQDNITNFDEAQQYISTTNKKTELQRKTNRQKSGVQLKGIMAVNPASGNKITVWISDYVLTGYGTGAVMAVPAHDTRDNEFARMFDLPIVEVINPDWNHKDPYLIYTGHGSLKNSGEFCGLNSKEAQDSIIKLVGGTKTTTYKLRDWGISRQRYWGCPIPVVYDPQGKAHAIPKEHLPWTLPTDVDHTPDGTAPLARSAELKQRVIDIFGEGWTAEYETMDAFVDSTWYFMRYLDPHNDEEFCSKKALDAWMPVSRYSGGAEHTTMHLLYARFFTKAMHSLGLIDFNEPFTERLNRSLILGPDGLKMSKSKGNVIDPDDVVARLGSDTLRLYLAFIGPYNEVNTYPWDPNGVVGVRRFIERFYRLVQNNISDTKAETSTEAKKAIHQTIKKVTQDIPAYKFNTAIAQLMTLVNVLEKQTAIAVNDLAIVTQLLAPFTPHVAAEIWELLHQPGSVHTSAWPKHDPNTLISSTMTIPVQVNGKVRAQLSVPANIDKDTIEKLALLQDFVKQQLAEGLRVVKVIYVPNKIINIVIKA